jgi:ACR3 family arsenite efflux pump ArsB
MMWPILTKIRYESLPTIFSAPRIWIQIGISLFLNWIVGPLVMVGLAWATLPDLPTYRTGVIMVGLARCIAMVVIWNQLARGNSEYCAILVVLNSVLQIILYSPYALLFINTIGRNTHVDIHVSYKDVAISVLIVRYFFLLIAAQYLIESTSVSRHTTCCRCHHSIYSLVPHQQKLLDDAIPSLLFTSRSIRPTLHHTGHVCLSRPSHNP